MEGFRKLFQSCGMKNGCDLLDVLTSISNQHSETTNTNDLNVPRDLKIALDILQELKPENGKDLDDDVRKKLLIPIQW